MAALRPDLAAQWAERDIAPDQVPAGSHRKVWWRCPNGPDHRWKAEVASRTTGGKGCPFCSGTKVSVTNSLASLHPEVARLWHPARNGDLSPHQVTARSSRRVWWLCEAGHDSQAKVAHRSAGHRCRECYLASLET